MSELVYMGRSDDNLSLIFLDDDGNEFSVTIDEHLLRDVTAPSRFTQSTPAVSDTLSPREIQMRIRRGETIESIAAESGESVDRIERYAGPVLAERHHMSVKARETFVRRSHGDVILEDIAHSQLIQRGIDILNLEWDSYRRDDGRWNITVTWASGSGAGVATWIYDPASQSILAADDEARWLFDEAAAAAAPEPVAEVRPRLVGLPAVEPEIVQANNNLDELDSPAWAGPGQPTMPVPVVAPSANEESPSWDDILFGSRPNDFN